jgi:hypothetical protein
MTKLLIPAAAAASLLCLSVPAAAMASDTSTATQRQAASRSSASDRQSQRICVRDEMTGSRMVRNICRTRAEWDRAGGLPTDER